MMLQVPILEEINVALRDALVRGAAEVAGFSNKELHDALEREVTTRLAQHFRATMIFPSEST